MTGCRGDSNKDERARAQVLHEMERRDAEAEKTREHAKFSWQLEQSCSWNVLGKKASMFDVDERVPRAVDDQSWHVDRGQNIADIDLADHPHDR